MIDANKVAEAERVFVIHEKNRKELRAMLNSKVFRQAWDLLNMKRRLSEQVLESGGLAADEKVSVRLHSQRIAVDERLDDLIALTEIPQQPMSETPATFSADNDQ